MSRHRPVVKIEFELVKEVGGWVCSVAKIRGALAYEELPTEALYQCAAIVAAQIDEVLPK